MERVGEGSVPLERGLKVGKVDLGKGWVGLSKFDPSTIDQVKMGVSKIDQCNSTYYFILYRFLNHAPPFDRFFQG